MTTRRKATPLVPLRTITAATTSGQYRQNWVPVRTEGADHEQVPSRFADHRKWRDGRVEMLEADK